METDITTLASLAVTETEKRLLEIILKKDEEIASLRAEKDQEIATLLTKIDELTSKLAWLQRQVFGSKTEHFVPMDDTPSLFTQEELPEPEKEMPHTTTVAEHERKTRKPNVLGEIPADFPREEHIIDVPEDQRQGMELIGYVESERIAYKTGYYILHYKRAKYADPSDPLRGVVTAPPPENIFDTVSGRCRYDVSLVAKVVDDKVVNAIPLERQARIMANEKLPVAPSTLEDLYKRTADLLLPLYERMIILIMLCDILHVDETFIKLLVKGSGKCKNAFLWCRMTGIGPPMIAFHFALSRSQDVAKLLLGDYSGTIIRDAFVGYDKLDCEVACCWAHVRRYLLEAYDNGYLKVEPLLKLVRDLYKIEHEAKDRAEKKGTDTALFQERKMARRTSAKLVDEFFAQAKALQQTERPSSPAAKAVSYALNIEPELRMFLKDSRLNIDNNPAERLNRGISIIRKNCLFAGSETGGQRLAVLYSFAATCKANNLCFRNWLEDVLPRLSSTPASQIDSLLPPFWKPISK